MGAMVRWVRSGKLDSVPFEPSEYKPRFTGGHIQTLYAWAKPRRFTQLPPPVERYFDVADDAYIDVEAHLAAAFARD